MQTKGDGVWDLFFQNIGYSAIICHPFGKLQACFSDWNLWMLDHRNLCWCHFSVVGVLKNYISSCHIISFHVPLKLAGCSTKTWQNIEVLPSTSLRLFRCQEKMMKIQPGPNLTDFLCRICWLAVERRTGWSMMKMSSLASWAPPSRQDIPSDIYNDWWLVVNSWISYSSIHLYPLQFYFWPTEVGKTPKISGSLTPRNFTSPKKEAQSWLIKALAEVLLERCVPAGNDRLLDLIRGSPKGRDPIQTSQDLIFTKPIGAL